MSNRLSSILTLLHIRPEGPHLATRSHNYCLCARQTNTYFVVACESFPLHRSMVACSQHIYCFPLLSNIQQQHNLLKTSTNRITNSPKTPTHLHRPTSRISVYRQSMFGCTIACGQMHNRHMLILTHDHPRSNRNRQAGHISVSNRTNTHLNIEKRCLSL